MPNDNEEDVKAIDSEPSADEEKNIDPDNERGESLFDDLEDVDENQPGQEEGDDELEPDSNEDPEELLRKKEEQIQNLNKALAEARGKDRQSVQPEIQDKAEERKVNVSDNDILKANEQDALDMLYEDHPELSPDKDVTGTNWKQFKSAYEIAALQYQAERGHIPLTAKSIYETGKNALEYLEFKKSRQLKRIKDGETKARSAGLGASKRGVQKTEDSVMLTDADRRAAHVAGMDPKRYAEAAKVFDEDVPV